ncbi:hypothetical protein ACA910_007343 [Epithemia clementina (nom. ined.)]
MKKSELMTELDEHNDFFDMIVDMFPGEGTAKSSSTQMKNSNSLLDRKSHTKNTALSIEDLPLNSKYYKKGADPPPQKMANLQQQQQQRQKQSASSLTDADGDDAAPAEPQTKRRKTDTSGTTKRPANHHNHNHTKTKMSKTDEGKDPESSRAVDVVNCAEKEKQEAVLAEQKQEADDLNNNQNRTEDVYNYGNNKSRIENLRAKLQAKIAEKQTSGRPQRPDQVSKRAIRRAEKRKRQEEAKKRGVSNKKSSSATTMTTTNNNNNAMTTADQNATPAQDLAQVDFGRLTGLNPKSRLDPATANSQQILQNLTKPKNLHKMLKDAEAKRQKLEELKQQRKNQENSEAAQAKLEAMQWKDAFKEADGTRIKDDPAKIKSALKRKAAKKAKSQKAWQSRTEQQAAAAKERQGIRQHNLQYRKQGGKVGANLSRKEIRHPTTAADGKKTTESGGNNHSRSRAGFEGRKREFLNKEKKKPNR